MVSRPRRNGVDGQCGKISSGDIWTRLLRPTSLPSRCGPVPGCNALSPLFMDLSTRRVELGGIAACANGLWMSQIARNLTNAVDGFFTGKRFLIHDRDPLYTAEFLGILAGSGIQSVKLRQAGIDPKLVADQLGHGLG